MIRCSVLVAVAGSGATPVFSASTPRWTSRVASPPSSRIMFGSRRRPGQRRICWVHHQYSSSVSPFQAKTGTPAGASTVPVRADRDRGGGVVLGGEDVAGGPAHLGAERDQRLDQHGGLDRHVQRARDARAGERLGVAVALAHRHQAGHLVLGELDLGAAEVGQGDVGDLVVHDSPRVVRIRPGPPPGPVRFRLDRGVAASQNPRRRPPGGAPRAPRPPRARSDPQPDPGPPADPTSSASTPPTTAPSRLASQTVACNVPNTRPRYAAGTRCWARASTPTDEATAKRPCTRLSATATVTTGR